MAVVRAAAARAEREPENARGLLRCQNPARVEKRRRLEPTAAKRGGEVVAGVDKAVAAIRRVRLDEVAAARALQDQEGNMSVTSKSSGSMAIHAPDPSEGSSLALRIRTRILLVGHCASQCAAMSVASHRILFLKNS